MRALLYSLVLLAVIVTSIALLRPTQERIRPESRAPVAVSDPAVFPRRVSVAPPLETGEGAEEPPRDAFGDAGNLLRAWHVREATRLLEEAVAADSTRVDAYVQLVECYSHPLVSREDAARDAVRRARSASSAADTAYVSGVRDLFVNRDYAAAARTLRDVSRAGAHPDAARYFGMASLRAGRSADADSVASVLLALDPDDGRARELSIRSLAAGGRTDDALEGARELARRFPDEPFPYVMLALVELERGEVDTAARFCNNALTIDARYIPAVLCRGSIYAAAGSLDAARVSFEKLLLFDDPVLQATGYEGIAFTELLDGEFAEGVEAMNEAIQRAMLAGAVRHGLGYASRLVDYLCELGAADAAEDVVERWVTGFGEVPEALGRLRIDVLAGRFDSVGRALRRIESRNDWRVWSRVMAVDTLELAALVRVGEGRYGDALTVLDAGARRDPVAAGLAARRAFLRGYASFENGDAETAREAFLRVRSTFFALEHPYRGDPVLYVQSRFYSAECALAGGREAEAVAGYRDFVAQWGGSTWDLRAVERAREKLENLAGE